MSYRVYSRESKFNINSICSTRVVAALRSTLAIFMMRRTVWSVTRGDASFFVLYPWTTL